MAERSVSVSTILITPMIGTFAFTLTSGPIKEWQWYDSIGFLRWLPLWAIGLIFCTIFWKSLGDLLVLDRPLVDSDQPSDTLTYFIVMVAGALLGALVGDEFRFSDFADIERAALQAFATILFTVLPVLMLRAIPGALYARMTRWCVRRSPSESRERPISKDGRAIHVYTMMLCPVLGTFAFLLSLPAESPREPSGDGNPGFGIHLWLAWIYLQVMVVLSKFPSIGERVSHVKPREWRGHSDGLVIVLSIMFGIIAGMARGSLGGIAADYELAKVGFALMPAFLFMLLPMVIVFRIPVDVHACLIRSRPPASRQ